MHWHFTTLESLMVSSVFALSDGVHHITPYIRSELLKRLEIPFRSKKWHLNYHDYIHHSLLRVCLSHVRDIPLHIVTTFRLATVCVYHIPHTPQHAWGVSSTRAWLARCSYWHVLCPWSIKILPGCTQNQFHSHMISPQDTVNHAKPDSLQWAA